MNTEIKTGIDIIPSMISKGTNKRKGIVVSNTTLDSSDFLSLTDTIN
jgi:hypothetical protein